MDGNGARDDRTGRRRVLKVLAAAGAGGVVFGRALSVLAEGKKVTAEMIRQAEWVAGVSFTDAQRELMLEDLGKREDGYAVLRALALDNGVPPALTFAPSAALDAAGAAPGPAPRDVRAGRPASDGDLAFLDVAALGTLLAERKVTSVELTRLALARLKRYDPLLSCVVSLTEELALEKAEAADRELAAGKVRGPLHGIPWAAKDLIAVPGYRTTWGSVPFKDQVRPETAEVYRRLTEAGAILVAKTSVGELAWGDVWFGGTTKNPWKLDQGSSGSSAGSAAATSAGLVPFALGTETLGSIVSPATRCGVTGLRPTFGRVSRYGVMALAWSMDKVGVLARTAEGCGLVFQAIHGADPRDPFSRSRPFAWPPRALGSIRVGYLADAFEEDRTKTLEKEDEKARAREGQEYDRRTLDILRALGVGAVPLRPKDRVPVAPLSSILTAEAATAFDGLVRSGKVDEMVRQVKDAWPNVFRQGELIPAVEYLRASRVRTLVMREMDEVMKGVDVYVVPSFGGGDLLRTNLTGHPCVVVPNGFRSSDGTPTSITFVGRPDGESDLLAVAMAFQRATEFHLKRPPLDAAKRE